MTLESIYYIGQTLAVLAILASLLFLAFQTMQNTRAVRASSLQDVLDGCRDRNFLPGFTTPDVLNIFARGLADLDLLDEDEGRRFCYYMFDQCFQMQEVMQLYQQKLISQVDYDAWLYYTASLFTSKGGKATWTEIKMTITPTISDIIDEFLADNPDHPSYSELNRFFNFGTKVTATDSQP